MALLNPPELKQAAKKSLSSSRSDPGRIVFLHTGAMLLLSLVISVVNLLLDQQMAGAGGLGGVGTRAMLETAQWVLQIAQLLLIPFWQIGYIYAMLRTSRGQSVETQDLMYGFHHFGPVLRMTLLQGAFYFVLVMLATNLASVVFALTPWAAPLRNAIAANASEDVIFAAIEQSALPIAVITVLLVIVFAGPVFYRLRMAQFRIVDKPRDGAMAAILNSRILMRGNCISLLKVDLSYWWYYLLELFITVLCYADLIFSWTGISLPLSPTASYFLCFGLYLVLQLGLYVWKRNEVTLTYAHSYQTLLDARMAAAEKAKQQQAQAEPGRQPWDY